jgi:hypothetical protein
MRTSIPFRTSPCDGSRTRGGCKTGTVCLHGEMRNGTSRIQLQVKNYFVDHLICNFTELRASLRVFS